MAIPTVTVTGHPPARADGAPFRRGTVVARLSQLGRVLDGSEWRTVTSGPTARFTGSGEVTLHLVPNDQISPVGTAWILSWSMLDEDGRASAITERVSVSSADTDLDTAPRVSPASTLFVPGPPGPPGLPGRNGRDGVDGPVGPSGSGPAFGNSGSTRYVLSSSGNDSNDGLTWTSAKRTFLAAFDSLPATGGDIFCGPSTLVGGEVSGQGIWILGTHDPQYANPPAGWRKQKTIRVFGVGGQAAPYCREPVSLIGSGANGTWGVADKGKPGIWIAGTSVPMLWDSIGVSSSGLSRAAVLGIASDRSSSDAWVANIKFRNCGLGLAGAAGVGRGPAVELGHTFWTTFEDCGHTALGPTALADPSEGMSAHQAGSAIATNLKSGASCGVVIRRGVSSMGGVHFDSGSTTWGITVEGFEVESDFVNPTLAACYLNLAGTAVGQGLIRGVAMPDRVAGSEAALVIRPLTVGPDTVVVENADDIDGPAWIWSQATTHSADTGTILGLRQAGFEGRRLCADHDGARRLGGPVAARFANLATFPPSSDAGTTITTSADPFGGNGAAACAPASGTHSVFVSGVARTSRVGDWLIAGIWMRAPLGARPSYAPAAIMSFDNPGNALDGAANYRTCLQRRKGDGQWEWLSVAAKVTTALGSSDWFRFGVRSDDAHPYELFGPVVYYLPVGTVSDNEAMEIVTYLGTLPPQAVAGRSYVPPGLDLAISDPARGLILTSPDGSSWRATISNGGTITWTKL